MKSKKITSVLALSALLVGTTVTSFAASKSSDSNKENIATILNSSKPGTTTTSYEGKTKLNKNINTTIVTSNPGTLKDDSKGKTLLDKEILSSK